jgi:hypothetical protein
VTDRDAVETYLVQDLGGVVGTAAYPAGGEGRITPTG